MKDLEVLKYFLGVEVVRSQEGLFLSQRKYAFDIVSEAGLLGAHPVAFPMEQNHHLGSSTNPWLQDVLSQFLHAPRQDHWVAALRVVKYSKGCPGQGDSPISWKTKKQVTVSHSSTEAEYRSLAAVTYGTIHMSHVPTTEPIADLFTKSLGRKQFEFLLRKLSI
ncbi:hypothetical protein LIER_29112 [Lithospermum erythrorhizon]|uniref:Reverse transcriptase Ty1/copia-type domain-containing protein n=1 Tax=Lithospermum erythrorhizon TaxID=34254 RepID=A0AAV3RII3_LITER